MKQTRLMRLLSRTAAGIAMLGLASAAYASQGNAPAKVYFTENFHNCKDQSPLVLAKHAVWNDPIWARDAKLALKNNDAPALLFKEFMPNRGEKLQLKDFDLTFFWNAGKFNGAYKIILRAADGRDVVFSIDGQEISVTGSGSDRKVSVPSILGKEARKKKVKEDPKNPKSKMIEVTEYVDRALAGAMQVTLQARGGKISLNISVGRVWYAFLKDVSIPPVSSFNLEIPKEPTGWMKDFVLSSPANLKDYSAQQYYADFRSIDDADGMKDAKNMTSVKLTGDGDGVKFRVRDTENAKMIIHWTDGTKTEYLITANDDKRAIGGRFAEIGVRPLQWRQFSCPQYTVDAYYDLKREIDTLPKGTDVPFDVDFRKMDDGVVAVYLDGSFATKLEKLNPLPKNAPKGSVPKRFSVPSGIEFQFGREAPVVVKKAMKIDDARFTVIDLSANPRAKAFYGAKSTVAPGWQTIDGIPLNITSPDSSADVAICKEGVGNWALEVDDYLGRSPMHGYPSELHYSVLPAAYGSAWIVCALDPSPGKDPVLTVRFARYMNNGAGGNKVADISFEMKKDESGAWLKPDAVRTMKQIGTASVKGRDVPVYLMEIPTNLGAMLDATYDNPVSFEFVGKMGENMEQIDNSIKPDPDSESAFSIFAVTLEKVPVRIIPFQKSPGNIFTADEKAETNFRIAASGDGVKGDILWTATDAWGVKAFSGKTSYSFDKADDSKEITIPLKADIGYYDLEITLTDASGKPLFRHPARFAILPKDERKATIDESPFGTWWFGWNHGSTGDIHVVGPILRKAGIRRSGWSSASAEDSAKYKLGGTRQTAFPISDWTKVDDDFNFVIDEKTKQKKGYVDPVEKIRSILEKQPATVFLIWHESAPGYGVPEEILGLPVPKEWQENESNRKRLERYSRYIRAVGKFRDTHFPRSKYPGMKIQIGNSNVPIGAVVWCFRGGIAKPTDIDYIGMEAPSQVISPETVSSFGLQGQLMIKAASKKITGKEIPTNGTYEFTYRCERDMGEQQQAEWYARDTLISLAHDYEFISPGLTIDCCTAYYNGLWGGSGMITRVPYLYPKRSIVAYAAITSVFDAVKRNRQLDTGSNTLYAFEFIRKYDKKYATAFWAARGMADFTVEFDSAADVRIFDMYGREKKFSGKSVTVHAGESPAYMISDKPAKSVKTANRTFPKDMKRTEKASPLLALDDPVLFESGYTPDPQVAGGHSFLPYMVPSDLFELSGAEDAEKGNSLKVTLKPKKGEVSDFVTEYTTFRLKTPTLIPGTEDPATAALGIWVRGNSNWAQLRFEIEDAEGEVFKGITTGGWGCDIYDWPGNMAVNFDGAWTVLAHPLRLTKLFNDHSPGPVSEQWVSSGNGNRRIDLPVKLRAITVGMNRTGANIRGFDKIDPSILIKGVMGLKE